MIRQIEQRDLEKIAEIRNQYTKYLRQWKYLNKEDQYSWFNSTKDLYFVLEEYEKVNGNDSDIIRGSVGLTSIDWISRKAEISLITEGYINEEYAMPLLSFILKYGFDMINLERIYVTIYEYDNHKIDFFKKNFFKKDAYIRNDVKFEGKSYGLYYYSMTDKEYRNLDKKKLYFKRK